MYRETRISHALTHTNQLSQLFTAVYFFPFPELLLVDDSDLISDKKQTRRAKWEKKSTKANSSDDEIFGSIKSVWIKFRFVLRKIVIIITCEFKLLMSCTFSTSFSSFCAELSSALYFHSSYFCLVFNNFPSVEYYQGNRIEKDERGKWHSVDAHPIHALVCVYRYCAAHKMCTLQLQIVWYKIFRKWMANKPQKYRQKPTRKWLKKTILFFIYTNTCAGCISQIQHRSDWQKVVNFHNGLSFSWRFSVYCVLCWRDMRVFCDNFFPQFHPLRSHSSAGNKKHWIRNFRAFRLN